MSNELFLIVHLLSIATHAQAVTPPLKRNHVQAVQLQHSSSTSSDAAQRCLEGARSALIVSVITTGAFCELDVYISGGENCLKYAAAAIAAAPTTAANGCAGTTPAATDDTDTGIEINPKAPLNVTLRDK